MSRRLDERMLPEAGRAYLEPPSATCSSPRACSFTCRSCVGSSRVFAGWPANLRRRGTPDRVRSRVTRVLTRIRNVATTPDMSTNAPLLSIQLSEPEASAPRRHTPWASALARHYRLVVVACTVTLFAYLLHAVGPGMVLASFRALSWRFLLVVMFPTVLVKVCDTLGWRCTLPRDQVPFWRLATAMLAGQAVASTTPTGMIGGNAMKAWMVHDRMSSRESLSSLVILETTS